jgi:membrane protease subunit HflC
MNNKYIFGLVGAALALFVVYMSTFIVSEKEQAILLRFSKIERTDFKPGLHLMVPFLDSVKKFERRILTLDSSPKRILTGQKKNVDVNYFAKWRICDVNAFYVAFDRGDVKKATQQLADVVNDQLQVEFNGRTIKEVVSDHRDEIMRNLTEETNKKIRKYGIQVVDVRIKQIELEKSVLGSVYERMQEERKKVAYGHRAEGEKSSRIIRAEADKKRIEILADARKEAEKIRGQGDAKATAIYAKAYNQDKEFFAFYRSLQGYRNSFTSKDDVIVLEPDSEFFKYFSSSK